MREFDFKASAAKLLTNDIVNMLGYIHEYKGQQNLFIHCGLYHYLSDNGASCTVNGCRVSIGSCFGTRVQSSVKTFLCE